MYSVSVIVPFYNVESYIERCARSLFEQTLANIEYIFIDDCSTDNSISLLNHIISEYPQRNNNIRVISHKQNKGVAYSRIEGYQSAQGEYVIHCDSDDYVDKGIYEKMYKTAIQGDYDMVVCDICSIYDNSTRIIENGMVDNDILRSVLGPVDYLVNKLVKRTIVQDKCIIPPKFDMSEDLALTLQYALMSPKVGYVKESLYYYVHRSTSILGVRTCESMLRKQKEFCENFDICIEVLKKKGKYQKYKKEIYQKKYYIKNYTQTILDEPDVYKAWAKTYPELNYLILSRHFSLRQKISYLTTLLGLYPMFSKLRDK